MQTFKRAWRQRVTPLTTQKQSAVTCGCVPGSIQNWPGTRPIAKCLPTDPQDDTLGPTLHLKDIFADGIGLLTYPVPPAIAGGPATQTH